MNNQHFLKYLPSFFILVGVFLWTNSLFFSPVANLHEVKLGNYWKTNFERNSVLLNLTNQDLQKSSEFATKRRPMDKPLTITSNKILIFQEITIKALNEKLENSDTNTYQIIHNFYKNTSNLLWEIAGQNPIVTDNDINNLLKKAQFISINSPKHLDYNLAAQKNQIYQSTNIYLNYLARKIGVTYTCFELYKPSIEFDKKLIVGNSQNGRLFLSHIPCELNNKFQLRVNSQSLPIKRRIAKLTKTFNDTLPKIFNVECEFHNYDFKNNEIITDTIILEKQFIIHPIKRK